MATTDLVVELHDEVKHKINDATGIVIAKFAVNQKTYLDVRLDDKVKYTTPITNWEVVRKAADII